MIQRLETHGLRYTVALYPFINYLSSKNPAASFVSDSSEEIDWLQARQDTHRVIEVVLFVVALPLCYSVIPWIASISFFFPRFSDNPGMRKREKDQTAKVGSEDGKSSRRDCERRDLMKFRSSRVVHTSRKDGQIETQPRSTTVVESSSDSGIAQCTRCGGV